MLGDPSLREGYVQGSVARGLEAAGSNEGGAAGAFLGVGLGMQATGGFMGAASQSNQNQINQKKNQEIKLAKNWFCTECGTENISNFCGECGNKRPASANKCSKCGFIPEGKVPNFCPQCGIKFK